MASLTQSQSFKLMEVKSLGMLLGHARTFHCWLQTAMKRLVLRVILFQEFQPASVRAYNGNTSSVLTLMLLQSWNFFCCIKAANKHLAYTSLKGCILP